MVDLEPLSLSHVEGSLVAVARPSWGPSGNGQALRKHGSFQSPSGARRRPPTWPPPRARGPREILSPSGWEGAIEEHVWLAAWPLDSALGTLVGDALAGERQ